MPRRLAQQQMTLSDPEWLFHALAIAGPLVYIDSKCLARVNHIPTFHVTILQC